MSTFNHITHSIKFPSVLFNSLTNRDFKKTDRQTNEKILDLKNPSVQNKLQITLSLTVSTGSMQFSKLVLKIESTRLNKGSDEISEVMMKQFSCKLSMEFTWPQSEGRVDCMYIMGHKPWQDKSMLASGMHIS